MLNLAKLRRKLKTFHQQKSEVIDLSIASFEYAKDAQKRFEKGDWETKKTLLNAVGSNLVLFDRKLDVQPRKPFLVLQNHVKKDSSILEPKNIPDTAIKTGDLESVPSTWGHLVTDVRTYFLNASEKDRVEYRQYLFA